MVIGIYIPRDYQNSPRNFGEMIPKGSGIVSLPPSNGYLQVYYEGNIYNADNLHEYSEKLRHASDRLITKYPTIARMTVNESEFIKVGIFDCTLNEVNLSLDHEEKILNWMNSEGQRMSVKKLILNCPPDN